MEVMELEEKDYLKITSVSKEFYMWESTCKDQKKMSEAEYKLWTLKIQLIIAQQLSVVSGYLGKIVRFDLKDRPKG